MLPARNKSEVITDPAALDHENITTDISRITLDANDFERPPKLVLFLLQPLANFEMLAACRNPASRCMRMGDGSKGQPTNNEYLNIAPLSQAWRNAMANAAPRAEIVFDIRLPAISEENGQKVYWDTSLPRDGGLAVHMQKVMTIAIIIATGVRMRVQGACRFGVSYHDEGQDWRGDEMKRFQRQLIKLAETKTEGEVCDDGEWVKI